MLQHPSGVYLRTGSAGFDGHDLQVITCAEGIVIHVWTVAMTDYMCRCLFVSCV